MQERASSLENLPSWVVDVKNSYQIMLHASREGLDTLGVGRYEGRPSGGKIEREETFDIREAFFKFLKHCKEGILPEAIPLNTRHYGSGEEELKPSIYFLPRTREKYSIVESFKSHPELYPDSPDFIGFEKLKWKEAGLPTTTREVAHIMYSGARFNGAYPTLPRDEFVEEEFGETPGVLTVDEVEIILEKLREKVEDDETLKLLDELESEIAVMKKGTREKTISERSRISNDIQRRAKNLVAVLRETGMVQLPERVEAGGNFQIGFFRFLPQENRLIKSGTREPVEYYRQELAKLKKKTTLLPGGKTAHHDPTPYLKREMERAKPVEATEEDWVICGEGIASALVELLPEKIREAVTKWSPVD